MVASISDVAARAGVSVATVSRALRDLPNVAPSTRERVLRAAAELDYIADPLASRLAEGRTKTIGMVVPLFTQWYFTQCVAGAEAVLRDAGYDVLLYNVSGGANRDRFIDDLPFRKRVDGVIVIDLPLTDDELGRLAGADVPVVTIGLHTLHFPSVTIDNVAAAHEATLHLLKLGHTDIALIGNGGDDPLRFTAPVERRQGFHEALAEHGVAPRADLDVAGGFTLQGGAEAMARLLEGEPAPTAVFAQSDEMAIGALSAARQHGLRVPEDLSIIGFDDHEMAPYFDLTTIFQPVVAQGERAAHLMLARAEADVAPAPEQVVVDTHLVERGTTGPRLTGQETKHGP